MERFLHLQKVHGYPKWFRFHSRAKKKNIRKTKCRRDRGTGKDRAHMKDGTTEKVQMAVDDDRKQIRRQRRQEKNKTIPCRYFHTKRGCRRGDRCMFLHDDSYQGSNLTSHLKMETNERNEQRQEKDKNAMDVEMDDLTNQIGNTRISVPSKICFGRRRR